MLATHAQQPPDLFQAVAQGHRAGGEHFGVEAVEAALRKGANVNMRDNAGWTPLMDAAQEGLPEVLALLLRSGADVNARSLHGDTALIIASGCFIVRQRAKMAAQRHLPESAAEQFAAPAAMVRMLLAAGAPVNAQRDDGRTALMSASMMSWPEVIHLLLRAGAKVNARDAEGRLAIDYVDFRGHPEIAQMLLQAGSQPATGHSGRSVCDAQAQLARLGYDIGPIDCIAGKGFTALLADFQRQHGLAPDGILDAPTRRALHVE